MHNFEEFEINFLKTSVIHPYGISKMRNNFRSHVADDQCFKDWNLFADLESQSENLHFYRYFFNVLGKTGFPKGCIVDLN